jgi:hypothetical protein
VELITKPVLTDLSYQGFFDDPSELIKEFKEMLPYSIHTKVAKDFELSLNSIKDDNTSPADGLLRFSKFDGPSWFEFAFGLEVVTANLKFAKDQKQAENYYFKAAEIFQQFRIKRQKMVIQQQLTAAGDADGYLESLNPKVPPKLLEKMTGRGVFYTLKLPDQELTIHTTVAKSLFLKNGIFTSLEYEFMPNKFNFAEAYRIAERHRRFILDELELRIDVEA